MSNKVEEVINKPVEEVVPRFVISVMKGIFVTVISTCIIGTFAVAIDLRERMVSVEQRVAAVEERAKDRWTGKEHTQYERYQNHVDVTQNEKIKHLQKFHPPMPTTAHKLPLP